METQANTCTHTNTQTLTDTLGHKKTETDTLPIYNILALTFAALILARQRSRFELTCATARRSTIIIKKGLKKKSTALGIEPACRASNRSEVQRLNHLAIELALGVTEGLPFFS